MYTVSIVHLSLWQARENFPSSNHASKNCLFHSCNVWFCKNKCL